MRILIAEDDDATRLILKRFLEKWGYEVVEAEDGNKAQELFHSDNPPQMAILDWMMPGMPGVDVCREVASQPGRHPYLMLLTTKTQKEDTVEGLEAGADAYVNKPFEPVEMKARIEAARRVVERQAELAAINDALKSRATIDSLTGLWNRDEILCFLGAECARANREHSSVGVIMADLDHFKQINDTYGHPIGDEVLKAAAERMRAVMRPYDLLGRYGGEEFLGVVRNPDNSGMAQIAERLRLSVCERPIQTAAGEIAVTLCLGTAIAENVNANESAALIRAADQALYRAKENGRNQVQGECDLAVSQ